jgi:hypothetical protein
VKRRPLMTAAAVIVVAVSGLTVSMLSAETPREQPPPRAELAHLSDRIELDIPALARQGVYVRTTGLTARCAWVLVDNLTGPNKAYLARRYGPGACLEQASSIPSSGCPAVGGSRNSRESKTVPDVSDLGLYEAERRLVAAGFGFSTKCPGFPDGRPSRPSRPSRFSPEVLVRVTRQCPAAGAPLAAGAPVGLQAEAFLPGGHRYVVGVFRGSVECTASGLETR